MVVATFAHHTLDEMATTMQPAGQTEAGQDRAARRETVQAAAAALVTVVLCIIAFGGVAIIALATSTAGLSTSAGALLCLLAAAAYAGGVVAQKVVLRSVSALQTTFLCCLVGAIACLPFAPTLFDELAAAPTASVTWVVYLGALPTALAFTTWAYALARTDAGRLGATTYLVPPLSVLLGWAFPRRDTARPGLRRQCALPLGVAVSRRKRLGRSGVGMRG
jgi:uncharacterized membrane protein